MRSPSSERRSAARAASSSRATFMLVAPVGGAGSARSFELDLAFELHRQLERRDLERDLGRKRLVSLDRPRLTGGGDRLLDRVLRIRAASARVELSSPVDASPASAGTRALAIALPSSTPH